MSEGYLNEVTAIDTIAAADYELFAWSTDTCCASLRDVPRSRRIPPLRCGHLSVRHRTW